MATLLLYHDGSSKPTACHGALTILYHQCYYQATNFYVNNE